MGRGRRLVSKKVMDEAEDLLQAQGVDDDEVEGAHEPIILADHVSPEEASNFMDEKHVVLVRYVDGSLIAVELPTQAHARTIIIIGNLVAHDANIDAGSDERVLIGGSMWQPDVVFEPKFLATPTTARGLGHPSVIFEVGDSESLKSLYRCATTYLDGVNSVQAVYCIKMWKHQRNNSRSLLMMAFERANIVRGVGGYITPNRVIAFGIARLHPRVKTIMYRWGVPNANFFGKYQGSNDPDCTQFGQALYQAVCLRLRF